MIAAIGVITVRWAALENELVSIFAASLANGAPAHKMFFSVKNLSQRLDLVRSSLPPMTDEAFAEATEIFNKISKSWNKRNGLIHSHYVYRKRTARGANHIVSVTQDGAQHPQDRQHLILRWVWDPEHCTGSKERFDAAQEAGDKIVSAGFGYFDYMGGKEPEFVPVNLGSLQNHAEAVSHHIDKLRHFRRHLSG